jgi:hypothetical protein
MAGAGGIGMYFAPAGSLADIRENHLIGTLPIVFLADRRASYFPQVSKYETSPAWSSMYLPTLPNSKAARLVESSKVTKS